MTAQIDVAYHGVPSTRDEDGRWVRRQILVEATAPGPTERQNPTIVRELSDEDSPIPGATFNWSYNGSGPSVTAAAVLRDALAGEPSEELREDFVEDIVAHLAEEWWLRQGAVLRWVRGWCAHRGVTPRPPRLATLPPIHFPVGGTGGVDHYSSEQSHSTSVVYAADELPLWRERR